MREIAQIAWSWEEDSASGFLGMFKSKYFRFWAEGVGPTGTRAVAVGPYWNYYGDTAMLSIELEANRQIVAGLVEYLSADRWEPLPTGPGWFSYRFSRDDDSRDSSGSTSGQPLGDPAASPTGMKKCPDCAEEIRAEARVCRFCRFEFPREAPDAERREAAAASIARKPLGRWRVATTSRDIAEGRLVSVVHGTHTVDLVTDTGALLAPLYHLDPAEISGQLEIRIGLAMVRLEPLEQQDVSDLVRRLAATTHPKK